MTEDTPTDPTLSTGTAERARIEPSPPPKRLDALPVLYLVGFVILAASMIYVWRHPTMPRGAAQDAARVMTLQQEADARRDEVAALGARIAQLESRPVPGPAPSVAPLEARLAALEGKPAAVPPPPVDLKGIEGRIAALETKPAPVLPPPVDLGPLEARIAALETKPAPPPVDLAPLGARVAALDGRLATTTAALTRIDGLEARLGAAELMGKQAAAGLGAIEQRAARSQRLIVAGAALEAGQRLGDIPGAPPAVARFAIDAPPTEARLRLSFNQAAEAAHRASQPAITDNQTFAERMWTRAQQSVTVRQGERVLVGDPISGVIAASRTALDAGDLAGAVKALDGLSGPARAAMAGWIDQAKSLLDARAALAELAGR